MIRQFEFENGKESESNAVISVRHSAEIPLIVVRLYTVSTCVRRNEMAETNERRLRHILDSKLINYEVICIDIQPTFATIVQEVSGNRNTPQLHLIYEEEQEEDGDGDDEEEKGEGDTSPNKLRTNRLAEYVRRQVESSSSTLTDACIHEDNTTRTIYLDYDQVQELEDEALLVELLEHAEKKKKYDSNASM